MKTTINSIELKNPEALICGGCGCDIVMAKLPVFVFNSTLHIRCPLCRFFQSVCLDERGFIIAKNNHD